MGAIALGGCVASDSYVCSDGTVCPGNTVCAPIPHATNAPTAELCVDPSALAECTGKADNATCTGGVCHDGVCLPIACGNGFVDPGEQCDDHNQISGDGCSADCTSTEKCGNGVRDGLELEECDDGNLVDGDGCDSKCLLESATWKQLSINNVASRRGAAMAYDIAHDQMVMFGGKTSGMFALALGDTALFAGQSWLEASPRTLPVSRTRASLAYDSVRNRVVMFGGSDVNGSHFFNETWLWDGHDWQQANPTTSPPARDGATMVFDSKRGRMILFGGRTRLPEGYAAYGDTWSWDGTTWTDLGPTTTPDARMGAAMSYDPLRDQVVMFGGTNKSDAVNTNTTLCTYLNPCAIALKTWTFDGTDWHGFTGTQPATRFDSRMAWDPATHTSLLFGGNVSTVAGTPSDLQDTWLWSGSTWTSVSPATKPLARSDYSMATNPVLQKIILTGGTAAETKTWQWNGATWSDVTPAALPQARLSQSAYDLRRGRNIALDTQANQTYEIDRTGWIARGAGPSDAFNDTAMAYDLAHKRTVLYGGMTNGNPVGHTWLWDGTTWTLAAPTMSPPPRMSTSLAYDPVRGRVVMFGGSDASATELADTWEWDGTTWAQMTSAATPDARYMHETAFDPIDSTTVVFGGALHGTAPNETPVWDGSAWSMVSPAANTPTPQDRTYPNMLWVPRRRSIILFSGQTDAGGGSAQSDTWEWKNGTWTAIATTGTTPAARGEAFPMLTPDGSLELAAGAAGFLTTLSDSWSLVWENASPKESCIVPIDLDGDGLAGCADPDCWMVCNPTCSPGVACDAAAPHCGDGTCDGVETCRMCPEDCGACPAVCGDSFCDPGETAASCPGDCH